MSLSLQWLASLAIPEAIPGTDKHVFRSLFQCTHQSLSYSMVRLLHLSREKALGWFKVQKMPLCQDNMGIGHYSLV